MRRLEGKVAIVTGATSGIGEAQAVIMARGRRLKSFALVKTKNEWIKLSAASCEGGEASPCIASVQNSADCKKPRHWRLKSLEKIDSLCNTAGIFDGFKIP
jgi:3-oxoacyl-[acyl-carrier protein] reductase